MKKAIQSYPVYGLPEVKTLIRLGIEEDIGSGDVSVLSCIPQNQLGTAQMLCKEEARICGLPLAALVYEMLAPSISVTFFKEEGDLCKPGDVILTASGPAGALLSGERLILNFIQRLSGVATVSALYAQKAAAYKTQILDTRKTTPGMRMLQKHAVAIGGCNNHRIGLFDMVMLKDNHIDYCGGIALAILKTQAYLKKQGFSLPIEVETRTIEEVEEACNTGGIQRIMLDNFSPEQIMQALEIIDGRFETEASGGIDFNNLEAYLKTGVDFISIGALTHSAPSIDISLKTLINN